MKKPRIYVDTSVIGGGFDLEFQAWSNGLIEDLRKGPFRLVLSIYLAPGRDGTAREIFAAIK